MSISDRERHCDGIPLQCRKRFRSAHGQEGPDPGGSEKSGGSGVTAQQDGQIAKAGVDALAKVLGR